MTEPRARDNWNINAIEHLDHGRAKAQEARRSAFPEHSDYAVRKIDEAIADLEAAKAALEDSEKR